MRFFYPSDRESRTFWSICWQQVACQGVLSCAKGFFPILPHFSYARSRHPTPARSVSVKRNRGIA